MSQYVYFYEHIPSYPP